MGTQSAKGADVRKKYSEELKRGMVDRFIAGESATALAEETGAFDHPAWPTSIV